MCRCTHVQFAALSCSLLGILAVQSLRGQVVGTVASGATVRLQQSDGSRLVGTVAALTDDTLYLALESDGPSYPIALVEIVRLEVQIRRSHVVRGVLVGGAVGTTFGFLLASAVADEDNIDCNNYRGDLPCIEPVPILPVVFGVLGAVVGHRLGRARWRVVTVSGNDAACVFFPSRGVALTLSVSF